MADDSLNINFTIKVDPNFRGSSEEMAAVISKFVEYARQRKRNALDGLISSIKDFCHFWSLYIEQKVKETFSEEQAEELLKVIIVRPLLLQSYSQSLLSKSELEELKKEGYRAVAKLMHDAIDWTLEGFDRRD